MINELPMYIVVSSPNNIEPAGDPRIPVHHPRVDPHPDSPNPHGYGHNSNTRRIGTRRRDGDRFFTTVSRFVRPKSATPVLPIPCPHAPFELFNSLSQCN